MTSATEALAAALAAEHAAIYGYGVVGGHLTSAAQEAARDADGAHRSRRDALVALLTAQKANAPVSDAAYALPFRVTDRASAIRLAISLEEGAARAWRAAIVPTTGDQRRTALDALVDCAVRATRWRRLSGAAHPTIAFPGTT